MSFYHPAELRQAGGGVSSVVLGDQLHFSAGQLPALLFKEKLEAVQHVLAIWRERSRKRGHEANLDRPFLRVRRRVTKKNDQCQSDDGKSFLHTSLLLIFFHEIRQSRKPFEGGYDRSQILLTSSRRGGRCGQLLRDTR